MSDLMGYFGSAIPSGSGVGTFTWGQVSFQDSINPGLDALKDYLTGSCGWTAPASPLPDGTYASCEIIAISFPCHQSGSDSSGVPDIEGGAFAGTFNGVTFQFYDADALPPDPDPTGGSIIGVPLAICGSGGGGGLGTLNTFLALASAHTPWNWSFVSGSSLSATLSVVAQNTGTAANVDSYQGSWAPNGSYLGGPGPIGGGWIVVSPAAPQTGDQFGLTIFESAVENQSPSLSFEMPYGSGQTIQYNLNQTNFNAHLSPYQVLMQRAVGASSGETGQQFVMASALSVPAAMGPVTYEVSNVSNASGSDPVVVTTGAPHNLTAQDRVQITGVAGATNVNGSWWVAKVPSPTTFYISDAPLVFLWGDGNDYTSGGTVQENDTITIYSISAVVNGSGGPVQITTSEPNGYQIGTIISVGGVGGITHLGGFYSVAEILSPTTFEIALLDDGLLFGTGASYSTGTGSVVTGIFNAMLATDNISLFMDDGSGTAVAAQGVFGSFSVQLRTYINGETTTASVAPYSVAINVPFNGVTGDMETTAAKPMTIAPYVALRIAPGQEAHMAGNLWDSYVEMQNHGYGEVGTYTFPVYGSENVMAWLNTAQTLPLVNATLWLRAGTPLVNPLTI